MGRRWPQWGVPAPAGAVVGKGVEVGLGVTVGVVVGVALGIAVAVGGKNVGAKVGWVSPAGVAISSVISAISVAGGVGDGSEVSHATKKSNKTAVNLYHFIPESVRGM